MAATVYVLCGFTSLVVAILLLRGYFQSGARLLLWSGLCFLGLTLNNVLVFVDLILIGPEIDLLAARNLAGFAGMCLLLYGLIWDQK